MNIRIATLADCDALAIVQLNSYGHHRLPLDAFLQRQLVRMHQDWHDLLLTQDNAIVLVVEDDARTMLGCIVGYVGPTDMKPYNSELSTLHVHIEYQHLDLRRRLVTALAERLWQAGADSLIFNYASSNSAEQVFYEALGGLRLGEYAFQIGENNFVDVTRYGWPNIEKLCVPENIDDWFAHVREVLETSYITAPDDQPWLQSGQSGPYPRWEALRKPTADCMNHDGTFLDIGCANGYLMECCVRWAAERGVRIEPYGLDYSDKLVALARRRLPQWADRFFIGNALTWQPPMRFDFVRTELVYVPADLEREYIDVLRTTYLNPAGKLLIAQYGEGNDNPQAGLLPGCHPTRFILDRLTDLGIPVIGYKDGVDAVKGRRTRIAIVAAGAEN